MEQIATERDGELVLHFALTLFAGIRPLATFFREAHLRLGWHDRCSIFCPGYRPALKGDQATRDFNACTSSHDNHYLTS